MLVPRLLSSIALSVPPPPPPTLGTVQFGTSFLPGDGGGYIEIIFTINDAVGGEYIEVTYDVTAGDPITTLGPGGPSGPYTASPAQVPVPLGPNASASATVYLYSASAVLLDTRNLPDSPL